MIMETNGWTYYTLEHARPFTIQEGDEWANDLGEWPPEHADWWVAFRPDEWGFTVEMARGYKYRRPIKHVSGEEMHTSK